METTGHRGLDELRLNCTQLAIDDYKNYISNWNKLSDSAKVQIYNYQKKIKRKMTVIEDYFDDGLFCSFADGVGGKVIAAIKAQMNFTGKDIVTEEEYKTAVKNLKKIEAARDIFLTVDEAQKRIKTATKTVRDYTINKIIETLKKMQSNGMTLKMAIKALEKGGEND